MLLAQLGEIAAGQAVKDATLDLLRDGVRTRDLGGSESTDSFTAAVAAEVTRRTAKGGQIHCGAVRPPSCLDARWRRRTPMRRFVLPSIGGRLGA